MSASADREVESVTVEGSADTDALVNYPVLAPRNGGEHGFTTHQNF